ncbi:MAG: hypothetical protein CBC49_002165 [Alphaproteobacteria bacterium TMED89]|nr:hypothetical protein [Rhodospirillaceae bacterium]RPH18771.1 MAG: hypothetical protein CBC49_002165 [Alphaproteobacteria bacterium TMED89]
MTAKETLETLMVPAGLCDPQSLRLVWANGALTRLLVEHGLEPTISVRTLASELSLPDGSNATPVVSRQEATLPASPHVEATTARCQLGPAIDVTGDRLLIFHLLPNSGTDASRATLNIFSRHMNAREAAWDQEREALLAQIEALKSR